MASAGLTLGALNLLGGGSSLYRVKTMSDGTDWGNGEPIETVLASLLQDGAVVITQGYNNREATIRVRVESRPGSGGDLADAEAGLVAELNKPNLLTWTPPDGSPATVYEVLTSNLLHTLNDAAELNGFRYYNIRLVCLPYARSVDEVITPAIGTGVDPPAPTVTSIDACTSTTGWARGGFATSGPTVVTGAIQVAASLTLSPGQRRTLSAIRSGLSTSMAGSPYLRVQVTELTSGSIAASGISFQVNGVAVPVAVVSGAFYYLDCTGLTINSVTVLGEWTNAPVPGTGTATLRVDDISSVDTLPSLGSSRQLVRSLAVKGTARTQATLTLEHPTSALGDGVIAYVYDDDGSNYVPSMRARRAGGAGSVSIDAARVSGGSEPLATPPFFDFPYSDLPVGPYGLMLLVKATTNAGAKTITWTAQTRINGVDQGNPLTGTVTTPALSNSTYTLVPIGRGDLRTMKVAANSTAVVRITLTGADVTLDEGWVFNTRIGQLIVANCGTAAPSAGGTSNRLFIKPATIFEDPTVLRGFSADQSDAVYAGAGIGSWMQPNIDPPSVKLLTVTPNALNAAASIRHYPRWYGHAAA